MGRTHQETAAPLVDAERAAGVPWTPEDIRSFLPERGRFTFPPPYGTDGIRVTNATDCGGADCVEPLGGASSRNIDAHIGRDDMLIFLGLRNVGPTLFRLTKRTGRVENLGPLFDAGSPFAARSGEGWYFSARRPATLYMTSGARLLRYDVVARTLETVFDAGSELGADEELAHSHSSDDDDVHSAAVRDAAGAVSGCVAYREDTGRISLYPGNGVLAGCEVDKSGRWLVMKADGAGADHRIIELETGVETFIPGQGGAGGASAIGAGLMIATGNGNGGPGGVRIWRFAQDPPQGGIFYASGPAEGVDHAGLAHSLALSGERACASTATTESGAGEIVCFPLVGPPAARPLAQAMSSFPRGNLDVTGRYFLWVARAGDRHDAVIVELPAPMAPDAGLTCPTSPVARGADFRTTVFNGSSANDWIGTFRLHNPSGRWIRRGPVVPLPRPATVTVSAPNQAAQYLLLLLADKTETVLGSCEYEVADVGDTTAPQLSAIGATAAGTSATVAWITDEAADTQVEYGTTTAYGQSTTLNPSLVVAHSQAVTGLAASTLYHYRVKSRDAVGNLATSADFTFMTSDTVPPLVSITAPAGGATVSGTLPVTATATDNGGVAGVQFKRNGVNIGAEDTVAPYSVSWNTVGLANGAYTLTAVARDGAGNSSTSAGVIVTVANGSVVTLAPQDTFINLDAINHSAHTRLMTYTWPDNQVANAILMRFDLSPVPPGATITDATLQLALVESDAAPEAAYTVTAHKVIGRNPVIAAATGFTADGVIAWTPNPCCSGGVPLAQADISAPHDTRAIDKAPGYKSWSVTSMAREWLASPATNFGVLLNSDASQLRDRYRYFASMEDPSPGLRPFLRVTYSLTPDVTPPVISGVGASAVGTTVATIAWTTNEASDSQVEYGTTTAYGSLSALNPSLVVAHTSALAGLTPNTLYHYRARSRDFAGNLAVSGDFTFTTLAVDTTPPVVAITAPPAGATVAATVTVTANATDNVGVVGVLFKRNGVNIGIEDTAAPYSVAWNTVGLANGAYALTAVARDAAGNTTTSGGVTVTVSNGTGGGIATLYPGDVGIETHPDVVFVERFEDASLPVIFARWTDILNGTAMSLAADVPAGSPGTRSLNIPWVGGGVNDGGHLYKQLTPGVDDTLYVRYYIKYPTSGRFSHNGIWMGGYNPPLGWPSPQAGVRPAGNDRFSAAAEHDSQSERFDHYDYWMNMHQSLDGNYWGNVLLNNPNVVGQRGQWTCVEQMVKLNNPVTSFNGEHAIWLNGVRISHLGLGFPNGTWSGGTFTQTPGGSPFEGFRWRSDANLKLNWIWLQNYAPFDPPGFSANMRFDHVVVAKSHVGCLTPAGPGDTTPPTVSVTAPAGGSTVSGTSVAVSAVAADNVGVAGVQFKMDGGNLGSEDTSAPYSVSWNTTAAGNGAHTLTAVARDAAGNTTTSAPVAVTVNNPTGSWPNQPAGFTTLNDQPWNLLTGNGWNYLRRASSVDAGIVSDSTAPHSPSNVLRMVYSAGCCHDSEPSVHWMGLPTVREIYTGWWMKISSNWIPNPAGAGKITFLWTSPDGHGQVYTNLYHKGGNEVDGWISGPPYRIGANTEWAPYGQKIWLPNVATTFVDNGEWHRIEFYYRWGNNGDGIIRWWVDGVLNGNYSNVTYPPALGFSQFEFAPTVQFAGPNERYMYIDHTRVAVP